MNSVSRNEYLPDVVSAPGETLEEILEERGMTQAALARRMDRPLKTINEIIRGKAAITPESALQLERVLGVSATFWNRRESLYREYLARCAEEDRLRVAKDWLEQLPLRDMEKQGWVRKAFDTAGQVREVLNFFGFASPQAWTEWSNGLQVAYRGSPAFASNPAAAAAWLRQGEIEAQSIACQPYDEKKFRAAIPWLRSLTLKDPQSFLPELMHGCASCGVAVVILPELPGTRLCGAARWLAPDKALVQLSLRHKTNDHLWFAFFHEIGHILLHGKRESFLDAERKHGRQYKEEQADRFASDVLIPPTEYQAFIDSYPRPDAAAIQRFAAEIGVAEGIVVGRLQHDGVLGWGTANHLKVHFRWVEEPIPKTA